VPQVFFAFLAAGSLFFSKITLILGKYQGDGFAADCFHRQQVTDITIENVSSELLRDFRRLPAVVALIAH
jgi:hypothetical protein